MVGQKPMYLHLLDRLAAVAERHKELEIVVVSQYEELLQEAVGEGPRPVRDPSVEKERRALLSGSGRLYPVYSPQSREGVSHSIRAGILAGMPGSSPISGMCRQEAGREPDVYVFFVADQPWLSERTVEAFLEFMKRFQAKTGKAIRSAAFPAWGSREIRCGFLHFIRMSFWLCPGTGEENGL